MRISHTITGAAEVRAELLRVSSLPSQALAATAVDVEDFAEGEAAKHNKRGNLVRSLFRRREGAEWVIGHDHQQAPHALFVHWGTRPHKIEPRRKKALRWAAGGAFFFAKAVNHPGYVGDPYFARAARLAPLMFEQRIRNLMNRG